MISYSAINTAFTILATLFVLTSKPHLNKRAIVISSALLLGCMLIFNTYLTALPIVRYNSDRILGLHIGTIPIEDFAYLAVALVLAPSVYIIIKKHRVTS